MILFIIIIGCLNTQNSESSYGIPTEEGYYIKLATAFKKIIVIFNEHFNVLIYFYSSLAKIDYQLYMLMALTE